MEVPFFDLKRQYHSIKSEIDQAITEVLASGRFLAGAQVQGFESELSEAYNKLHCVGIGSGAQGLEVVLRALEIGAGDEVITTAFSWVATAHAISMTGAKPVFCDIDPETFLLDTKQLTQHISSRTKAIIPVHLYGQMPDMSELQKIAETYDLYLIEDAAQAHFSTFGEMYPGGMSNVAVFSFYPTKQLGAYGDAGAILCKDQELAEKCRRIANHGALFPERDYQMAGTNSRLDELQASVLRIKLKYLDKWVRRRKEIAGFYLRELKDLSGIRLPIPEEGHSWYLFTVRVEDRKLFSDWLEQQKIGFGVNYEYILPKIAPYFTEGSYPHSEQAAKTVINLPCFPELSDEELMYVCTKIKEFFT